MTLKGFTAIFILLGYYLPFIDAGRATVVNGYKFCFTDFENIGGYPRNKSYHYLERILNIGCTHVIGNLILTDLHPDEHGKDPDLSFLKTIKEVSGYVIIMYSTVRNIPLNNLQVIRAENKGYRIYPNLAPASLIIRKNFDEQSRSLGHVELHNLRSIVQGSVYIYDNPGLCGWSERINWQELFENPGEQRVFGKNVVEEGRRMIDTEISEQSIQCESHECSQKCENFSDAKAYCWGSKVEECQLESRCSRRECNRCYNTTNGQYCCHEQCLGGCFGPKPDQCLACRSYNDSGTCVPNCQSVGSELHNKSPTIKFRLGSICVADCPDGFFIENDACVMHCMSPGMYADGRFCKPCGEQCPKTCNITYPTNVNDHEMQILGAEQLRNLTNCTYLKGNLIIDHRSFRKSYSTPDHQPIKEVEELWALRSLRQISGYVYLDFGYFEDRLKNLTFLENLVEVNGYEQAIKCSIMIRNSGAVYPGLRSLRRVPHGSVIFLNNSRMCYVNTLPWLVKDHVNHNPIDPTKISGTLAIIDSDNAQIAHCDKNRETCHSTCDVRFGCWGPAPEHCIRCAKFRAAGKCVDLCDDLPGFMSQPLNTSSTEGTDEAGFNGSASYPDADYWCMACHPECRQTCSGPGAHECVGGCKTAWANGRCVSSCDFNTYFNEDLRICETCSPHCHPRSLTKQSVCTGPGRHFGHGGCNKCEKLLLTEGLTESVLQNLTNAVTVRGHKSTRTPNSWICIRGDCPQSTYLTTEMVHPESTFANVAESFTSLLPICKACHSLCAKCTAFSVSRANGQRHGCIECLGYWYRDRCVIKCPEKNTYQLLLNYTIPSNASVSENFTTPVAVRHIAQQCLACHSECHTGCWGPENSQCFHCHIVRVHLSLVPDAVLKNHTELQTALLATQAKKKHQRDKLPHLQNGPALCLPQCPIGLPFILTDPFSGDRLCHFESQLSIVHRKQIIDENSVYTHPMHPPLKSDQGLLGNTNTSKALLVTLILGTVLITIILCCYCCGRIRVARLKKYEQASVYTIPFLGLKIGSGRLGKNKWQRKRFLYFVPRNADEMELEALKGSPDPMVNLGLLGAAHDANLTWRSTKAPNLGRLVMIQSDDLILDNRCGPLGTGAFGAVYRGVWRVNNTDASSNDSNTSLVPNRNSTDASQSQSTMSTALPSQSMDYEESAGTERTESQTLHPKLPVQNVSDYQLESYLKARGSKHRLIPVAVKILNETRGASDLDALLDEAKVMASVSHRNCLPLLGVCLSQSRKCLVSAYVDNGSLERYLRANKSDLPISLLIDWCKQIADGMTYLQSRGIIHRDLATRNVLVTSREHLQITDFGLAKMLEGEDEENGGELVVRSGRVPIRWLAIETLTHGLYSFKTDVWAYGVTIWEVFSFGKKPYEYVETSHVKSHILSGNRLPQPPMCTPEIYHIMLTCWLEDPHRRPNFVTLLGLFQQMSNNSEMFQQSRESSTLTTNLTVDGSQSLLTSSQGHSNPSTCELTPNNKTINEENLIGRESSQFSLLRRFDPRRRTRCSLLVPTHQKQYLGKFAKYQPHKRRSTECRPDNSTMSTSLSMTSSGLSDRWSHSPFSRHSHPVLGELQETKQLGDGQQNPDELGRDQESRQNISTVLNPRGINTDSWASSDQPLLASDQNSSNSQLMLSNIDYSSIGSNIGVSTNLNVNNGDTVPRGNDAVGERTANRNNDLPDMMPSGFEVEAAAGYVWPHWPLVTMDAQPPDSLLPDVNESSSAGDEELTHLMRQLWLRRNARQLQFYQRQSQIQRNNLVATLPEQPHEETLAECASEEGAQTGQREVDSEFEDVSERYCPDPTSNNGSSTTRVD